MKTSDKELKQHIMEAVDGLLTEHQIQELEHELKNHPNPEYLELYRHFKDPPPLAESFPDMEPSPFAGQRMVAKLEAEENTFDTVELVFKRFILAPMIALLLLAVGLRYFNNPTSDASTTDTFTWIELDNQTPYYQIPDYAILQEVSNKNVNSENQSTSQ